MAKHTPTSWRASKSAHQNEWSHWIMASDGGLMVAAVTTRPDPHEADANARLVAAAPDLLEACKKANTCVSLPDAVRELCRAAVRRAEGE